MAVPVELKGLLSQRQLLFRRQCKADDSKGEARNSESVQFVCSVLTKILQRGDTPLPTLSIEREALQAHGLLGSVNDLSEKGVEMGWVLNRHGQQKWNAREIISMLSERDPFTPDPEFRYESGGSMPFFDSPTEDRFMNHWIPDALGESAAHWFTPQASLDDLVAPAGAGQGGERRVDFLFHFPGHKPLVIEIDGEEHESAQRVDAARDAQLSRSGFDVLRVPNEEVEKGHGPALEKIKKVCSEILGSLPSASAGMAAIARVARDCSFATAVQLAIVRALQNGWLRPDSTWTLKLAGVGRPAVHGVVDILHMLASADTLYGGVATPQQCVICSDDGSPFLWNREGETTAYTTEPESDKCDLHIRVESGTSPFHTVSGDDMPDVIIRPAYLPVQLANAHKMDFPRRAIQESSYETARPGLRVFLQNIFRKSDFRLQQGEAIHNALCHNDCVVLLPTGAGKSIIYQLAGLLLPGITLVIDPLISLIEDQVEGLAGYGIDHVAPIGRRISTREGQQELFARVERGECHFVLISPERMQTPGFRRTLQTLAHKTFVNLAVIDEAHCVSEWGHDFRPAYLNLPRNLREFCRKEDREAAPPLLALTGTASRVVLRDVLRELDIDQSNTRALIRPESFDRPELRFEICRVSSDNASEAALRGVFNALSGKIDLPPQEIFVPYGRDTASGIVFVPTVGARRHGIIDAAKTVRDVAGPHNVTTYSGSPPWNRTQRDWDIEKRENSRKFKDNEVCVLVATKAFGMGIDKPNIRYTVHFGMPLSLENFYQEVGRAGRDQQPAHCTVIFSEQNPARSDRMLDPSLNLEALRGQFQSEGSKRGTRDDIMRALWFHLNGFRGVESEIGSIGRILEEVEEYTTPNRVGLPFWSDEGNGVGDGREANKQKGREVQERAIHRLVKLGVIRNYETDFGSQTFNLDMHGFDAGLCKAKLFEYIQRAQPAKSGLYREEIDNVAVGEPDKTILDLARILVGFTYETIEQSRRRMIQEAMLFARQSESDSDIRRRLLHYLQEGLGAEDIYDLAEATEIDFASWFAFLEKPQGPLEASELRGLLIRALESYPDHPGLLLTRAIAESMCADYDYGACRGDLTSAIQKTVEYGLGDQLPAIIRKVHGFARDQNLEELSGLLVLLLHFAREENPDFPLEERDITANTEGFCDTNVRCATLAHQLRDLASLTEKTCTRLRAPPPTSN